MKPLRDCVIVSRDEAAKQTTSGLFIPANVDEKVVTGVVLAVGTGRLTSDGKSVPLEVSVGDKVVFNKNLAIEIKVDGETVSLLREDQIYCVL